MVHPLQSSKTAGECGEHHPVRSLMARALVPVCAILAVTIVLTVVGAVYVVARDGRDALEETSLLTLAMLSGGAAEALWNVR